MTESIKKKYEELQDTNLKVGDKIVVLKGSDEYTYGPPGTILTVEANSYCGLSVEFAGASRNGYYLLCALAVPEKKGLSKFLEKVREEYGT
jgi:hypothetical protein